MLPLYYTAAVLATMLGVSRRTITCWAKKGTLIPEEHDDHVEGVYTPEQLTKFPPSAALFAAHQVPQRRITPTRAYRSIELFAGGGGMALGMEKVGFEPLLLCEWDKHACNTLRKNRPHWNVVEGDVSAIDFTPYRNKVDMVSGGFPCQSFSYSGKRLGFEDTRGTLFFEFARAVKETNAPMFMAENVRGLLTHDEGKTLATIREAIAEIGYTLIEPKILKGIFHQVPQKRERLILVGIRNDLVADAPFHWPAPNCDVRVLRDALKAGCLYDTDAPLDALGQKYPKRKGEIMALVPEGGHWKHLPDLIQREYMKKSYFLGGGKTGMARRLSWDEPSLTLTCAPAQKQTERCHPELTRPLNIAEYARIQTFPDEWHFSGPVSAQYKQIGNAVPVNLSAAVAEKLIETLECIEKAKGKNID